MNEFNNEAVLLLGRIDGKLTTFMEQSQRDRELLEGLDSRVVVLETAHHAHKQSTAILLGIAGTIGAVLSALLGPALAVLKVSLR